MAAVFLERAESLLTTYHIELVGSPWNTALLALTWWEEVARFFFYPLPAPTGVTTAAVAGVKWAAPAQLCHLSKP